VRLCAAHHALAPPVVDHTRRHFRARPVEPVEGAAREIAIELRAVAGQLLPRAIEDLAGQTTWIARRLHHERRDGADDDQLGDSAVAVTSGIAGRFATTG